MKNLFSRKTSVALSAILMTSGLFISSEGPNVSHAATIPPPPPIIQNFEQGNGTPGKDGIGDYCHNIWYADCKFELENTLPRSERSPRVPESKRALRIEVRNHDNPKETGGTVRIFPSSEILDLSKATSIHLWVYDTQGNNTIELKLCNGGNCPDSIWSTPIKSRHNTWKKITWPVSKFENVDKSRITGLEIYEWNSGIYYIDDIGWE